MKPSVESIKYKRGQQVWRTKLPAPLQYFENEGLKLSNFGEWRSAICPFHDDHHPSLRIKINTGGFLCMACGARGGDVLAFHMLRYGLRFIEAARELGALDGGI